MANKIKHGGRRTRLYRIWIEMKRRCYNPNCKDFAKYGARGIKLSDSWKEFLPFSQWAISNGYNENMTIERIDCNGDYTENNCSWILPERQPYNRRTSRFIEFMGIRLTFSEWGHITDLGRATIRERFNRGWEIADIILTPARRVSNGRLHSKI